MMQARCTRYSLPLFRPLRTSQTVRTYREGMWLTLSWPNGLCGIGEAAGWPGFGAGEDAVFAAQTRVERALLAAAPHVSPPPPVLGHERKDAFAWVQHARHTVFELAEGEVPLEWSHALETALCDAAARQSGLPLCRFLSPNASLSVPVHTQVQSASEAQEAVRGGARHLKLKIGHRSRDDDGAHVAGVRAAVGDAIGLRLDANGAWGQHIAERVACMLAAAQPEWIEQPCPPGDIDALIAVGRTSRVPVAVDEGLVSPAALRAHLSANAASIYVLKPLFLGGPLQTLQAARQIAQANKDVCVTHAMESSIGATAVAHVAAALSSDLPPERVRAHGLKPMVDGPLPPLGSRGAELLLAATPGLGVEPADAVAS